MDGWAGFRWDNVKAKFIKRYKEHNLLSASKNKKFWSSTSWRDWHIKEEPQKGRGGKQGKTSGGIWNYVEEEVLLNDLHISYSWK